MDPLLIVLLGTAVMIAGLLGFRLPAFLALLLGALVVVLLTPVTVRHGQALRSRATIVVLGGGDGKYTLTAPTGSSLPTGPAVLFRRDAGGVHPLAEVGVTGDAGRSTGSFESPGTLPVGLPGLGLMDASLWKQSLEKSRIHPLEWVGEAFGATCGSIGLLILLASIIGDCLTQSGAAIRIVQWIQEQFGERRAPQALASSAFLLGIPVFFDTVFYLLMPLGRGLAVKTGRNFLLYTLSIVAGATMAHSLVPPTPGPLFAAREFGVSLGVMMMGGTVVGMITVVVGFLYARWANRRWPLALRGEFVGGDGSASPAPGFTGQLPPLAWAVLPIVLPLTLIALAETGRALAPGSAEGLQIVEFLGQGSMALLLGTAVAVLLLVRSHSWRWAPIKTALGAAVSSGGVILLITAAGGAFGAALRQTDVAARLSGLSGSGGFGLLLAAFGVTALVRIAQGSATVAMLTAAGVVAPVALATPLPFHPVYLALAVGCGSKPVPWMNDSGFWIIGRMSGMTELETLRSASVMMTLMGCVGFGVVLLGAWLLPLK